MALPPADPRRPLDGLTRRTLLRASCGLASVGILAGAAQVGWREVFGRAQANPLGTGTPILVLVTMYGGNDGLSTVVPYAEAAYHDARPDLAFGADEVITLDETHGLNPGLSGLGDLWGRGKLAVVRGVGHPALERSHFRAIDVWQTASPQAPVPTGWVGRWLDARAGQAADDPLLALHLGAVLPPLGVGATRTAAALTTEPGRPASPSGTSGVLAHFAAADRADSPAMAEVVASYAAAGSVRTALTPVEGGRMAPSGLADADSGLAGATFSEQLDVVARCIRLGVPTRVYSVSLSGFDTHADAKASQTTQLTRLDRGLTALRDALDGHPREADVVVMAYSEFGRRVRANTSHGTDHGTSGPVLLAGERVVGGFHGDAPSLTDLVDGDLRTTTDFRRVYGDVLRQVLHADPEQVLDSDPAPLGLFQT
ncbi:MAG: DUF1501 domain-containing protein [Actinomycetota bacterium]|nr:DUF1501 domain-containing protein [Actinomycetota bacterium]